MIPKFHDAEVRPPQGGWSYPINGVLVTKHSEGEILEEMERWHRNNNTGKTREQLERDLWLYYCHRQPARCGDAMAKALGIEPASAPAVVMREKTPEVQGPPIWLFLNTLGARWTPGLHDYFLATCDAIISILECPICANEWRQLLAKHPPQGLSTRLAVCQWINLVHNEVSARKGKQHYPYLRMVSEFGAPLP